MRQSKVQAGPKYCFGGIGGRTTHPADPDGEIFGPAHWPRPQGHECGASLGQKTEAPQPQQITAPPAVPTKGPTLKTITGLVTLADFIGEAEIRGVTSPGLIEKLEAIFSSPAPNEGMRRMRCNNLLRWAENNLKRGGEK